MKRLTAVLLFVVLMFSVVACGEEQKAEKYCWNCGEGITNEASFCEHCGATIKNPNDNSTTEENISTSNSESEEDITSDTEESKQLESSDISSEEQQTESSEAESSCTPEESNVPEKPTEPETPTHTHSYSKKVTAPTCTEQGYTTYTCSCGNTYKSDYVSASHNYSKYKCTKCGTIDSSHSYSYLCEWLLNNGTTYGEYVYIENYFDDDAISIKYYPEVGNIIFAYSGYSNENFLLTHLYIYEDSKNADYISGSETSRISGRIKMSSHTTTYPLSCDSCQPGEYETEHNMLENTRTRINYLLTGVEYMLAWHEVGVSIKDIGFVSFNIQ